MPEVFKFTRRLTVLLIVFYTSVACGQNLAYKSNYGLSPAPNYSLSGNQEGSLTDGVSISSGRFWQQSSTTGWQYVSRVEVEIDLLKQEPIGEITFNTARGESSRVNYPKHVFAFLSVDGENFIYVGDVVGEPQNVRGPYQVHNFRIRNISTSARYIHLVAVPDGQFLFADEIQVIRGGVAQSEKVNYEAIDKNSLKSKVDSLINASNKLSVLGASKLLRRPNRRTQGVLSSSNIEELEREVKRSRFIETEKRFDTPFIVEKLSPWADVPIDAIPQEDRSTLVFDFMMLQDGVEYGGVLITNNTEDDLWLNVSFTDSLNHINLYQTPRIYSRNEAYLIDPLVPLVGNKLKVPYGSNELLIFKVSGKRLGDNRSLITITSPQKTVSLEVMSSVLPSSTLKESLLNVNTWAYLDYPMLKNKKDEVVRDLNDHHNNVTVVHSGFIPKISDTDFSKLIKYISQFPKSNKILLFVNFRNKSRRDAMPDVLYMSPQWRESFISWYGKMISSLEKVGFSSEQIYLYPYDEIKPSEVSDFIRLSKWAKVHVPNFQLFVTVLNKNTVEVISFTDVAQVQESLFLTEIIPSSRAEIWSYEVIPNAREKSAYEKYRLMSWNAYLYDLQGVGFWNYADIGKSKDNLITSNIHDLNRDYAVIYNSPSGEIITSRRWEAFKLGVEDFNILKLYEDTFGKKKALSIVKEVLESSDVLNKADLAKIKMIEELSSIF